MKNSNSLDQIHRLADFKTMERLFLGTFLPMMDERRVSMFPWKAIFGAGSSSY